MNKWSLARMLTALVLLQTSVAQTAYVIVGPQGILGDIPANLVPWRPPSSVLPGAPSISPKFTLPPRPICPPNAKCLEEFFFRAVFEEPEYIPPDLCDGPLVRCVPPEDRPASGDPPIWVIESLNKRSCALLKPVPGEGNIQCNVLGKIVLDRFQAETCAFLKCPTVTLKTDECIAAKCLDPRIGKELDDQAEANKTKEEKEYEDCSNKPTQDGVDSCNANNKEKSEEDAKKAREDERKKEEELKQKEKERDEAEKRYENSRSESNRLELEAREAFVESAEKAENVAEARRARFEVRESMYADDVTQNIFTTVGLSVRDTVGYWFVWRENVISRNSKEEQRKGQTLLDQAQKAREEERRPLNLGPRGSWNAPKSRLTFAGYFFPAQGLSKDSGQKKQFSAQYLAQAKFYSKKVFDIKMTILLNNTLFWKELRRCSASTICNNKNSVQAIQQFNLQIIRQRLYKASKGLRF